MHNCICIQYSVVFIQTVLQIVGAVTTYLVILIQFQITLPNAHQNETTSHVAGSA